MWQCWRIWSTWKNSQSRHQACANEDSIFSFSGIDWLPLSHDLEGLDLPWQLIGHLVSLNQSSHRPRCRNQTPVTSWNGCSRRKSFPRRRAWLLKQPFFREFCIARWSVQYRFLSRDSRDPFQTVDTVSSFWNTKYSSRCRDSAAKGTWPCLYRVFFLRVFASISFLRWGLAALLRAEICIRRFLLA